VATEDPFESEKHVIAAIERATGVGLLATVATEGYRVRELIERAAWRVPQEWLDRLRRLTRPPAVSSVPVIHGPEQLTARELEVLRLLASRLTLREIAGVLFVSQNTLKFHLRTVYRKLDVHGRAEALEMAKTLGLNR
jgi:LuxR family maltose regulon positive regulatory protein